MDQETKKRLKKMGRKLKSLRVAKGMSRLDLANQVDLTIDKIGRIEGGEDPWLSILTRIAEALEAELAEILKDEK